MNLASLLNLKELPHCRGKETDGFQWDGDIMENT